MAEFTYDLYGSCQHWFVKSRPSRNGKHIDVFVAGPQYEVVSASTVKQMIDFEPYSFYGASLRHWDFHCPIYCC